MLCLSPLARALLFYGMRLPNHPRKWWLHSRLRDLAGVRPDREFEVVRDRLTWFLNPADFADEALFWLGTKDSWDVQHLKRLATPGDVILDVGANFGYYALTLADSLRQQCLVHALEPDPANFKRLQRHIASNALAGVVLPHELGVSDCEGTGNMNRHPRNSGHAAVMPDGEVKGVRLTTLDKFCEAAALDRLDILVLDVEGLEERALRGAGRILARFRPLVFVELFPPVMLRQNSSPQAAASLLTEQGYELFVADRDSLVPLTTMPSGDVRQNVFAFHADKVPVSLGERRFHGADSRHGSEAHG
jgi:FkbM family methyltransferase